MKIIKPSYEILTVLDGQEILKKIELAARVCYKSEGLITEASASKLVKNIIQRGHLTPLEHVIVTVRLVVDRGVMAELTRHRHATFNVESSRYCDYSKDKFGNELTFIKPDFGELEKLKYYLSKDWEHVMREAEIAYFDMLDMGTTPELARSVLPMSLATELVMTANLREWLHIFNLRVIGTTGKPHPQMVEALKPVLVEFKAKIPIIFDDLMI